MRRIILCTIVFIFLPALCFSQPAIKFDSENYDAGITTQGDIIEHNFEFTNEGDEVLIIEKLTSS
jgi:uncharacterized protein YxjI